VNRPKIKGTSWETAIVNFLREAGWPDVERRALNGTKDRGDIAGLRGIVVEAKNAARLDLAGWLTEAEMERINAGADIAAVWAKRKGKTSPGQGYVIMSGTDFLILVAQAGR